MSFLLKKVQQIIEKNLNNNPNAHFLLAVSGGIDSMVLLNIFHHLGLYFHVAHANFQLRGEESLQDERFVIQQCKNYSIAPLQIHVKRFDTTQEHEKTKDTSIQMIARKLRYEWFFTLLQEYSLHYLVTAHHADDNIETFFLKLFRKSRQGLAGMDILSEHHIFRPLLTSFRSEIEQYAQQNNILYREDTSNAKDDYLRNHIRHYLVPFIENHYPQAKTAILETMQYQKENDKLADEYVSQIWQQAVSVYQDSHTIDLSILEQYPKTTQDILPWHFAQKLGLDLKQFEQFKHLFALDTKTGKEMLTQTYKAVRYKKTIQVFPINKQDKSYTVKENAEVLSQISKEQILIRSDFFTKEKEYLFADIAKIQRWYAGAKILHHGKYKLIADLIPEYHITPYQKEYMYLAIKIDIQKDNSNISRLVKSSSPLGIIREIDFVFFCPNSILLQLK